MVDEFHVGVAVPFSGPGGQYGPSAQAVTEVAISDINRTSGIARCEVKPVWIDAGHNPSDVARRVQYLLDEGQIDAITGWHTSAVREALAPIAAGTVPYVYPALYEGGETMSRVLCTGETPDLQIMPAIRWLKEHKGAERWAIVGDDYVWPRKTAETLTERSSELGINVEAQWFVSQWDVLSTTALANLCKEIRSFPIQGILILMVGQNAARFNREFARHLQLSGILRFSPLMDENTLLASGIKGTRRLFTAGGYFSSLTTEASLYLTERFVRQQGVSAPVLSTTAESCYEGLMALRSLVDSSQRDGVLSYDGPRGSVAIGSEAKQTIYIAQAKDFDFIVLDRIFG